MNAAFLSWWNLIFLVPFAIGALLVALSLPALGRHGGSHRHAAHRHQRAATAKTAAKHAARQRQHGTLPPLMWLQNALLCWGAIGYGVNLVLGAAQFHAASVWAAAGIGGVMAWILGTTLSRVMPVDGSAVVGRGSLQGRIGEAGAAISLHGGEAFVRDDNGTLHHIACRSREPIARGQAILVVEWDESAGWYGVKSWSVEQEQA